MPARPVDGPAIEIREIDERDLGRLLEINQANVPAVGSIDPDRLRFLVAESVVALVVDVEGLLAGFALVLPLGSGYDSVNYRWFAARYDDIAYLDRVAFDASSQRLGLGRRLYGEIEQRLARIDGVDALALEVNIDPPNDASLAFHRRLGFAEIGRQDTDYGVTVSMQIKRPIGGPA